MMVKIGVSVLLLSALSWPAMADKFCYLWVGNDGSITSYQGPPINITSPSSAPLDTPQGRLMIALTSGPCHEGRVIREATVDTGPAPVVPSTQAP